MYLVKVSYGFGLQLMSDLTSNLNGKSKAYKNILLIEKKERNVSINIIHARRIHKSHML